MKPLLLMDIDGPCNPWKLLDVPCDAHRSLGYKRTTLVDLPKPIDVLHHPDMGGRLRGLAARFDLMWCTYWDDSLVPMYASLVGLPSDIPCVPFTAADKDKNRGLGFMGSWKTDPLSLWLPRAHPGRPFLWFDDEINRHDRMWIAKHYSETSDPPKHLMYRVDASLGLTSADFDLFERWADTL